MANVLQSTLVTTRSLGLANLPVHFLPLLFKRMSKQRRKNRVKMRLRASDCTLYYKQNLFIPVLYNDN